jgi:hypothetical protein
MGRGSGSAKKYSIKNVFVTPSAQKQKSRCRKSLDIEGTTQPKLGLVESYEAMQMESGPQHRFAKDLRRLICWMVEGAALL